jgi:hypothetical protein
MFRNVGGLYRSKSCYSPEQRSFSCHRREKRNFNNTNRREATSLRNAVCFIPNKRTCEDSQGTQQNVPWICVYLLYTQSIRPVFSVIIKLIRHRIGKQRVARTVKEVPVVNGNRRFIYRVRRNQAISLS